MSTVLVGIALGSNLGDRFAEIEAGIAYLRSLALAPESILVSTLIETVPVGCPPGALAFLNGLAEITVDPVMLPPRDLLRCLKDFERTRGRPANPEPNTPRPLDLDLIYYGDRVIEEEGFIIPHPRAAQRPFVLAPLAQLRPDLVLPGQTATVQELLAVLLPGNMGFE